MSTNDDVARENAKNDTTNIAMPVGQASTNHNKLGDDDIDYNIAGFKTRFDPLSVLFAVVLLIGGVVGYYMKASWVSLIVSFAASLLIVVGTYIDATKRTVLPMLVTTTLLVGGFAHRYYKKNFKFYPSGFFLLICLIMLIRYSIVHYFRAKKN